MSLDGMEWYSHGGKGTAYCMQAYQSGDTIQTWLIIAGADFIVAAAVFFFLEPSRCAIASISGLAIVLQNFIPLPVSTLVMIMNVILLILGFLLIGREFGVKTVYTSLLLPVFLGVLERLFPGYSSLTGDQMLDALCYILVVAVGQTILFHYNASSGGTDILAKIINKFFHLELGSASAAAGMVIALSSAAAYDSKTVVISVLGTYFSGVILDNFIFGFGLKRRVTIVTHHEQELIQFILDDLHSGASVYEFYGAYKGEKHREVVCIVDRASYQKLMNYVQQTDPTAFVTVYNISSIRFVPLNDRHAGIQ